MAPQTSNPRPERFSSATSSVDIWALEQRIATLEARLDARRSDSSTSTCKDASTNTPASSKTATSIHDEPLSCKISTSPSPSSETSGPPVFTGSHKAFKSWQAQMYAKLSKMQSSTEETKIEYVLSRLSNDVFNQLMDTLPLLDGRCCRYCSAQQMVRNMAQYYDEDVRKVDLRFGCYW